MKHSDKNGGLPRAIDDPEWVLDRYREAKELIDECICIPMPDDDLRQRLNDWE